MSRSLDDFLKEYGRLTGAVGMEFSTTIVRAFGNPADLRDALTRFLLAVDSIDLSKWDSDLGWSELRLDRARYAFASPMSRDEAEKWMIKWQRMNATQRAESERNASWSLEDVVYWLHPDRRAWFVTGFKEDLDSLLVFVDCKDDPCPLGALRAILKASGAKSCG